MGLNVRVKTLILGGTNEGRDLAELLVTDGHEVITSLAGRVRRPARIAGEVRVGGFGGANGLAAWLVGNGIDRVVDANYILKGVHPSPLSANKGSRFKFIIHMSHTHISS